MRKKIDRKNMMIMKTLMNVKKGANDVFKKILEHAWIYNMLWDDEE